MALLILKQKKVVEAGKVYGNIKVLKGQQDYVNAISKNDEYILLKKGESKNIKQIVSLNKYVDAPVKAGSEIGTVKIYNGNNLIKTVSLKADKNVKRTNLINAFEKIYKSWIKNTKSL